MSHVFLQEEIVDVIYKMAATDFAVFYDEILANYLRSKTGILSEEQEVVLYNTFERTTAELTFKRKLEAFQNDFHYARMINKSASS